MNAVANNALRPPPSTLVTQTQNPENFVVLKKKVLEIARQVAPDESVDPEVEEVMVFLLHFRWMSLLERT